MRTIVAAFVLSLALGSAADARAAEFTVTSSSYSEGGRIPMKHACGNKGGSDTSIQLSWSNAPAGTKAFAIIMDDPDARKVAGYTWVHWNVFNVPSSLANVPETKDGKVYGALTTRNHFGSAGYGGPCPPRGRPTYITAVYALNAMLADPPNAISRSSFEKKFKASILSKAETRGKF